MSLRWRLSIQIQLAVAMRMLALTTDAGTREYIRDGKLAGLAKLRIFRAAAFRVADITYLQIAMLTSIPSTI